MTSRPAAVLDARRAVRLIGSQIDAKLGWELRALDPQTGRVVWSALQKSNFQFCPTPNELCAREGTIYVAHEGSLSSIDGTDGRVRWRLPLPGRVASVLGREDSVSIHHLHPGAARGVVAFTTEHGHVGQVTAVERDTGATLWRRRCSGVGATPIPGVGVIVDRVLYRAHDGAPLLNLSSRGPSDSNPIYVDRKIVVAMHDYGPDRRDDGVLVIDVAAGRVLTFHAADGVDLSRGLATFNTTHIVAADEKLLFVDPGSMPPKPGYLSRLFTIRSGSGGARPIPFPGFRIVEIARAGSLLALDLRAGEDVRRIVLLDPRSLVLRHDSGQFQDTRNPGHDLRIAGDVLAYTVNDTELWAVSGSTGQPLWSQAIGVIRGCFVLGGDRYLVYGKDHTVTVLRAGDGKLLARYEPGRR